MTNSVLTDPNKTVPDTADTFADIREGFPGFGLVASFCARLGQPAEPKNIKDVFVDPASPKPNGDSKFTLLYKLSDDGQLIALLRASHSKTAGIGTVYDVSVDPDWRLLGLAKRLIRALAQREPTIRWRGYPARVVPDLDRNLAVIRTLYGVSLVLGFREIAGGAFEAFARRGTASGPTSLLLTLLAMDLTLLGIRLFWAVGVIRRFVLSSISAIRPARRLHLVLEALPVLFLHAVFFFFLGSTFHTIAGARNPLDYAAQFTFIHALLLLMNSAWLYRLRPWQLMPLRRSFVRVGTRSSFPEAFWIRSNALFGLAGLILLALVVDDTRSTVPQVCATLLFIINSVVDFCSTSEAYAWGDSLSGG